MKLGFKGEEMDLNIRQGADLGPYIATMTNESGTPVDLTDCTIRGQIRKTYRSPTVAATIEVLITDPVAGVYRFGLSNAITVNMPCGEDEFADASSYVWDLELQDSAGKVFPLYYGKVSVFREITK